MATRALLLLALSPAQVAAELKMCAHWCHLPAHCADADHCGACSLCDANKQTACTPHSTSDLKFEACQGWCNAAQSQAHCASCSCKACEWCANAGVVTQKPTAVVEEDPGTSTAGVGTACAPHSDGDSTDRRCESFCHRPPKSHSDSSKPSHSDPNHCYLCRCQACRACTPPAPQQPPPPPHPRRLPPSTPPVSYHIGASCTPFNAGDSTVCAPSASNP